jgi:stage V sporulation protein D (sporulation-specific penicillin-binding protein)
LHHRSCGEVLPYLEVKKQEDEIIESVTMPDITGMSINDAKKALKELGLEMEVIREGETVTDQLPKNGIKINSGTKVTIYAN